MSLAVHVARRMQELKIPFRDRDERLRFTAYMSGRESLLESTKDLSVPELEALQGYLRSDPGIILDDLKEWREEVRAEQFSLDELIEGVRA